MKQFNNMTRRLFFEKGSLFCFFWSFRFIDHEEGKGKATGTIRIGVLSARVRVGARACGSNIGTYSVTSSDRKP